MRNIKISNWIKILLIILILVPQLIYILHPNQAANLPQPTQGKPTLIDAYVNFNNIPISEIVDDGTYMYILVDSHRGYVQVYDMNGQYQHMLSFARQATNGAFSIASKDGYFYVRDNGHNIYVFQLGQFLEFVEDEDTSEKLGYISFNERSNRFKLRLGSVWRTDLSKPICVVERPFYSIIYQYSLDKIFVILGVILLIITHKAEKKTANNSLP